MNDLSKQWVFFEYIMLNAIGANCKQAILTTILVNWSVIQSNNRTIQVY